MYVCTSRTHLAKQDSFLVAISRYQKNCLLCPTVTYGYKNANKCLREHTRIHMCVVVYKCTYSYIF